MLCYIQERDPNMDSVDRISRLPENIFQEILLLLPPHSLAVASTVSRTWRQAHASLPEIHICEDTLTRKIINRHLRRQMVLNFADAAFLRLENSGVNLQKFTLSLSKSKHTDVKESEVKRWVGYATNYNLHELRLSILWRFPLNIQKTLLSNWNSLTVLELTDCYFQEDFLSGISRKTTMLYSLRKLSLHGVDINDDTFEWLISCCPFVTELSLGLRIGITTLQLDSLSKLKKVYVSRSMSYEKIVITSLDLEYFHLDDFHEDKVCDVDLDSCRGLKVLIINSPFSATSFCRDNSDPFSKFPLLKTLIISCWKTCPSTLMISSPLLEKLRISFVRSVKKVIVTSRNLQYFRCDVSLDSFFLHPVDSEKLQKITFRHKSILMDGWEQKLRLLFESIRYETIVVLSFPLSEKETFRSKEDAVIPIPKRPLLGHLKLKFLGDCDLVDIVDDVLNTCCPSTLSIKWMSRLGSSKLLPQLRLPEKLVCERKEVEYGLEVPTCCSNTRLKCWRHYIENYRQTKEKNGDNWSPEEIEITIDWPLLVQKRQRVTPVKPLGSLVAQDKPNATLSFYS